jgi:hypothetical protein
MLSSAKIAGILATNGRTAETLVMDQAAAGFDISRMISSVVERGWESHGS